MGLFKRSSKIFKEHKEFFNTKFDLVFGIGDACSCTTALRKSHIQFFSHPFDWVGESTIEKRIELLTNNFENWFEKDDLVKGIENNYDNKKKDVYLNQSTKLIFVHDFEQGVPFEEMYSIIKEKYDRRIKRLYSQIEKSKNILLVYLQSPQYKDAISNERLVSVSAKLQSAFPHTNIRLLYLHNIDGQSKKIMTKLSNLAYTVCFDYNAHNKEFLGKVEKESIRELFNNIKITNKFVTRKNQRKRFFYLLFHKIKNIF